MINLGKERLLAIKEFSNTFRETLMMTMIKSIHVRNGQLWYDDCVSDFSLCLNSRDHIRQALELMYELAFTTMKDSYLKNNLPEDLAKKVLAILDIDNGNPSILTLSGERIQLDARVLYNISLILYNTLDNDNTGVNEIHLRSDSGEIIPLAEIPYFVRF